MTIEYGCLESFFDLIFSLESRGLKLDAKMILFMFDCAIIQLLDPSKANQRHKFLDYFINALR